MNTALISVIIPVYNAGKYFNHCIESIVNQTYKNLEIIIVDDGSTDETPKSCDEWAKKDKRIKVIHKKNGGASSARNVGIDNAVGEYIGFVDADDYIDSDMYEVMLSQIIEHNADAARCGIIREADDGKKEDWTTGDCSIKEVNTKDLLSDVGEGLGILPVSPCNKLYKAECIGSIRFDTRFKFAEDTLFNFQVSKNIKKMVYNDVCRYHYILNYNSASNEMFDEHRFDEHRVMDIIFEQADSDVLKYCIKGDVMKTFRTIKQMCRNNSCMNYFPEMRNRIIKHKTEIFQENIYSKITKLKTLFLYLFPCIYKVFIKAYAKKHQYKLNSK